LKLEDEVISKVVGANVGADYFVNHQARTMLADALEQSFREYNQSNGHGK
jgi:hypothetical protein